MAKESKKITNEKPISLYNISFEEAVTGFLNTKPPPRKKRVKKGSKKIES